MVSPYPRVSPALYDQAIQGRDSLIRDYNHLSSINQMWFKIEAAEAFSIVNGCRQLYSHQTFTSKVTTITWSPDKEAFLAAYTKTIETSKMLWSALADGGDISKLQLLSEPEEKSRASVPSGIPLSPKSPIRRTRDLSGIQVLSSADAIEEGRKGLCSAYSSMTLFNDQQTIKNAASQALRLAKKNKPYESQNFINVINRLRAACGSQPLLPSVKLFIDASTDTPTKRLDFWLKASEGRFGEFSSPQEASSPPLSASEPKASKEHSNHVTNDSSIVSLEFQQVVPKEISKPKEPSSLRLSAEAEMGRWFLSKAIVRMPKERLPLIQNGALKELNAIVKSNDYGDYYNQHYLNHTHEFIRLVETHRSAECSLSHGYVGDFLRESATKTKAKSIDFWTPLSSSVDSLLKWAEDNLKLAEENQKWVASVLFPPTQESEPQVEHSPQPQPRVIEVGQGSPPPDEEAIQLSLPNNPERSNPQIEPSTQPQVTAVAQPSQPQASPPVEEKQLPNEEKQSTLRFRRNFFQRVALSFFNAFRTLWKWIKSLF